MKKFEVLVIGGGPAGMMSTIEASCRGASVILIEKNDTLGKKLLISGNGRCNFANTAGIDTFIEKFGKNGRFLRDAFSQLPPEDIVAFFESRGLKCKVEPGGRIFPYDDNARSVLDVMEKEIDRLGVTVLKSSAVKNIECRDKNIQGISFSNGTSVSCQKIILTTGGKSYPSTGSSGDGLVFAEKLGHKIIPTRPGLVPILTQETYPAFLQGISLQGISLKIFHGKRSTRPQKGDIMFTEKGLSGPLILSISENISYLMANGEKVSVSLDILPGIGREKFNALLTEYTNKYPSKNLKHFLKGLMPSRLCDLILSLSVFPVSKNSGTVSRKERTILSSLCKDLRFSIRDTYPLKDAMVTAGG